LRLSKFFYLFKQDIIKNGTKQSNKFNHDEKTIEESKFSKYSHDDDELKLISKKNMKKEVDNKSIFS
jgi:hypothetical protein